MAVAEGDIVYLVFRGETGKLKVSGRVVAVEEDTLVVCGFPDKFGGLEEVVKGKAADSGRELCFVRVEQSAVSKQLPAGWNRDPVPKLAACKKVWAETGEIALSSEAEAPGSKQPSGSTEKPATSARAKSSLERDLFDLEGLWALSEESEEEEDETVEKAGNRGGKTRFLAPGASGRDSDRSKDRSRDKKGTDVMQAMLRQGLEAGQSPSELMPLMMMGWMMNQGGRSRRHKHRKSKDWDLLGGSSSESSDDSGDQKDQGMKAVSTLHKLHRRIKSRPRQVIHAFEQEVREELGILPNQPWTLKEYLKRQNWGKFKGIYRCAVMDAEAYELLRSGQVEAGTAQLVQNLKAKMQSVIQGGDWATAWLLTGIADPLSRKEFGGNKQEMAVVSGYVNALQKLRKQVRENHSSSHNDEEDEETSRKK